jgi:hypothetical protein
LCLPAAWLDHSFLAGNSQKSVSGGLGLQRAEIMGIGLTGGTSRKLILKYPGLVPSCGLCPRRDIRQLQNYKVNGGVYPGKIKSYQYLGKIQQYDNHRVQIWTFFWISL